MHVIDGVEMLVGELIPVVKRGWADMRRPYG
jgi:hypothetical protein